MIKSITVDTSQQDKWAYFIIVSFDDSTSERDVDIVCRKMLEWMHEMFGRVDERWYGDNSVYRSLDRFCIYNFAHLEDVAAFKLKFNP